MSEKSWRRRAAGAERGRCSRRRRRREDEGIKDLRVANLNEKQGKETHQAGGEAFKMTIQAMDPMQVQSERPRGSFRVPAPPDTLLGALQARS